MTDSIFLDTNILVYAYDKHYPKKQGTAQVLLKEGIETESVVLSNQVLGYGNERIHKIWYIPVSAYHLHQNFDILNTFNQR